MTAKERYKLAQVVLSKVGANGDLYGELAKAMTLYDQMSSLKDQIANTPPPIPGNLPPQGANEPVSEAIPPEMGQSTDQGMGGSMMP